MSWLPDPSKFLRRSYRKESDHEKPAKAKAPPSKSGGSLQKHSSLYSLMASEKSSSLERSTDNISLLSPSSGALKKASRMEEVAAGDLNRFVNLSSAEASLNKSRAEENELAMIRQAANLLISGVPLLHENISQKLSVDTTHDTRSRKSKSINTLHMGHEESSVDHDLVLPHEVFTGTMDAGSPFCAPANSDNEDSDDSECKVISEDLTAARVSQDGNMSSFNSNPSKHSAEKKLDKVKREPSKQRANAEGKRREFNGRKASVMSGKSRQPNSMKSLQKEGRKSIDRKGPQLDQVKESKYRMNTKAEKNMEHHGEKRPLKERKRIINLPTLASINQATMLLEQHESSSSIPRPGAPKSPIMMPHLSISFEGGTDARRSVHKANNLGLDSKMPSPLMTGRMEPDSARFEERSSRRSTSHNGPSSAAASERSSLMNGRSREAPSQPTMQYQMFSSQDSEIMGARISVSDIDVLGLGSTRPSPLMTGKREAHSPFRQQRQMFSSQDSDKVLGEKKRVSVSHDNVASSRRRSPLMVGRTREPSFSIMHHETFSLEDSRMIGESARISVGESARISVGRDSGYARQSPLLFGMRELPTSPLSPSQHLLSHADERRLLFDRPPSPLAREASTIFSERERLEYDEIGTFTSYQPGSQHFYSQKDDRAIRNYLPTPPLAGSKRVVAEGGRSYHEMPISPFLSSKPTSPFISSSGFFLQEEERPYSKGTSQGGAFNTEDVNGAYNDEIETANRRSSFYDGHRQQGQHRRVHDCATTRPRTRLSASQMSSDLFDQMRGEEGMYQDNGSVDRVGKLGAGAMEIVLKHHHSSRDSTKENLVGAMDDMEDKNAAAQQHYIRQQRDILLIQGEDLQQAEHDERVSQSSESPYHLTPKSTEEFISKSGPPRSANMSSHSSLGSSLSLEKSMIKRLQVAQAEVATARWCFENMVMEMVGNGGGRGDNDVQDLLDLEEFVESYQRLAFGGHFKGVVDQFFYQLCCELLEPVNMQENDSVLSMGMSRIKQLCRSTLPNS